MRHFLAISCLCLATACAGSRAASMHTVQAASNSEAAAEAEGMKLSHSEPDAPHCFTATDGRLICPQGGSAIYSASDAVINRAPPSLELDPNCNGANASAQCAAPGQSEVAEDTEAQ